MGQSTAIHRSSSSLWQPRAGTAACDWLEDSLHRVVKGKKNVFRVKSSGQVEAKILWLCGENWSEGEGQALSRSPSCCNFVLHFLRVKIYFDSLICLLATQKNPTQNRGKKAADRTCTCAYRPWEPLHGQVVPDWGADLKSHRFTLLLQYLEGQGDCPGTSKQVAGKFLGL